MPELDVSDATPGMENTQPPPATTGSADDAALKKAEANRKKREKAKAKKAAAKEGLDDTPSGRWQRGKLPGGRAERRAAPERGLGVFALEPVTKGEVIAAAPPALSVVFDPAAELVCSFCFDQVPIKDTTSEHAVSLRTSEGSFGVVLDDLVPPGGTAVTPVAVITRITSASPNRGVVRVGDRLIAVKGAPVGGGHAAAVPLLKAALDAGDKEVAVSIARPAALHCQGCKKVSVCERCAGNGCMQWHNSECALFQAAPDGAKQGDSSILRMLLRYKATCSPSGPGEWSDVKEPMALLSSLQGNACDLPPDQIERLAKLSGLPTSAAMHLIYQVRTNACEISRGGVRVGCALSVLMGWHNHDCAPNAAVVVSPTGDLTVTALKDIADGEEITISYTDIKEDCEKRRATLLQHYGFECKCARCVEEQRKELKQRMKEASLYRAGQRR